MPSAVVIDYHDQAFDTSGPRLMGAQSAAEGFLQAYLKFSGDDAFHVHTSTKTSAEAFARCVSQFAPRPETPVHVYGLLDAPKIAGVGCLYHGDPQLAELSWERRRYGDAAYSLCGVTHTTCTQNVMDQFSQLAIAPLQPWDALICTSTSVRTTIDRVLEAWWDYLAERLGTTKRPLLELPVIPLGVDCDRFEDPTASAHRKTWRALLGIGPDDVAFLFFGRLSFHAKANPFPMYTALETAAQRIGKKVHLIQAGWFANEALEQRFQEAAKNYCPHVSVKCVDGRRPDVRKQIWFAADAFTSLSDNIQETFGLTPIEAMAACLPSVISDWDGYRDTVRHGVDGFRIDTTLAPPGVGEELILRHVLNVDTYDRYIGHASLCAAVDIPQCVQAYTRLIQDNALRRTMGEAARRRARETFDWRVIIGRYQELWRELAARRTSAKVSPPRIAHPLRQDPFVLFQEYATRTLTPQTVLHNAPRASDALLQSLYGDAILNFTSGNFLLPTIEEMRTVRAALTPGSRSVGELIAPFPPQRQTAVVRGLVWLLKTGLVELRPS